MSVRDEERAAEAGAAQPRPLRIAGYELPLPRSRLLRLALGIFLVLGGLFSILPVFGLWMLPLGLIVLSVDLPLVRRWRRRFTVWLHRRFPRLAAKIDPRPSQADLPADADTR